MIVFSTDELNRFSARIGDVRIVLYKQPVRWKADLIVLDYEADNDSGCISRHLSAPTREELETMVRVMLINNQDIDGEPRRWSSHAHRFAVEGWVLDSGE